jgi:hypothetical protein
LEPDSEALEAYARSYGETLHYLDSLSTSNVTLDARGQLGAIPLSQAVWAEAL